MHIQEQLDGIVEKWNQCTARKKAEIITVFLNECGEHTKWEDWITFLDTQRQVNGVECISILSELAVVEDVLIEHL
jgi:uncharacterized Fe-S cluster-containing radical SAM superfamily enzyme